MRMACEILLQSSHLSPISMLPADPAEIIERTIRAAVEHHFYELKTSINHEQSNIKSPDVSEEQGCYGNHGDLAESRGDPAKSSLSDQLLQQKDPKRSTDSGAAPEEGSGMDLDSDTNTAGQDNQACDIMEQSETISYDSCGWDQNANTSQANRNLESSCHTNSSHAPRLQLFPDHQWEDPVPAFKSWQDESESGEAQLSPLAGRMVPLPLLPLEEDAEEDEDEAGQAVSPSSSRSHPHLLARRFLDFGAHSAQRFLQQDPDATSPTKTQRPRRASFGSKETFRGDSMTHQLTKKLQHLKKKIKQFEEQFEKERNYKPSHGDKAANPKVLKWMTDLTKIRRQIKDAKHRAESEFGPLTRPRSNTLPKSFGSTLDHGAHDAAGEVKEQRPTREETLELIQQRVKGRRQEDGWPEDVKKMTKEQLSCEKTVLQKNLLHYEGLHGRPVTREERLVVKPLYERYRLVKQMLTRVSIAPVTVSPSSKRRSQTLQPIIEGETAHFWEEIKEEEEEEKKSDQREEEREEEEDYEDEEEGESSSGGEMQSSEVIMAVEPLTLSDGRLKIQTEADGQTRCGGTVEEGSGKLAMDLRLSSSNASSMPELLEQLWKARAEKKKLRKTIRDFEEDFYQHNGRNVQKEDRVPMMEEYREYKRIKAKLRLLEVLISKQDSSKSI